MGGAGDANRAVKWSDGQLTGVGELTLYRQAWVPDGETRAVVALVHGLSEHSGRYQHVAGRLVAEGYAVHALDHRGHGRSAGPRSLVDRFANLVTDLDALVEAASLARPDVPLLLVGHSMGGLVATHYAVAHGERLSGLALSGALAAVEAASPVTRVAARVLSALTPRLGVIEIDSNLISRDREVVSAYRSDPLVFNGRLPARTVSELELAVRSLPDRVGEIALPTLIMYGTADGICPPAGSIMLNERIGARDKTLDVYDGLYHEIFNEPERERVLADLCAWLKTHV